MKSLDYAGPCSFDETKSLHGIDGVEAMRETHWATRRDKNAVTTKELPRDTEISDCARNFGGPLEKNESEASARVDNSRRNRTSSLLAAETFAMPWVLGDITRTNTQVTEAAGSETEQAQNQPVDRAGDTDSSSDSVELVTREGINEVHPATEVASVEVVAVVRPESSQYQIDKLASAVRRADFDKRAKLIAKRFRLRRETVQVRNLLWFAPPLAELHGVSLRIFHEWNPVRVFCADVVAKPQFQMIFIAVNLFACVLLAVRRPNEQVFVEYDVLGRLVPKPYYSMENVHFVGEYLAFLVLGVEVSLAVVARGLIFGPYAFVKDPFNLLDASVLVISFFELILYLSSHRFSVGWTVILRGMRLLRLLKPLLSFQAFKGCRDVILTLWNSTRVLFTIAFLFCIVLLSSALVLVDVFGGTLKTRCVVEGTDTISMIETFNDTSRIRPLVPERYCSIISTANSLAANNDTCPEYFVCDPAFGNPGFGFAHADNVLAAAFIVMQAVSGDGVDTIMWRAAESRPGASSIGYLIVFVAAIINLWLLMRAGSAALVAKYLDLLEIEETSKLEASVSPLGGQELAIPIDVADKEAGFSYRLPRWQMRLLYGLESTAILAILTQGIRTALRGTTIGRVSPAPAGGLERILFSSFFAAEAVVRAFVGRHGRRKTDVYAHFSLDVCVVMLDVSGILGEVLEANGWEILRATAALRWYRIMLLLPGARQVLVAIACGSAKIITALVPMMLLTIAAAIASRHLFRDNVDESTGSRNSFKTLGSALAAVFQIEWGDHWMDLLYESINAAASTAKQMRLELDSVAQGYAAGAILSLLFYVVRYCGKGLMLGVMIESVPIAKLEREFKEYMSWIISTGTEVQRTQSNNLVSRRITSSVSSVSGGIDERLRRAMPWYDLRKPLRGSFIAFGVLPDAPRPPSPDAESENELAAWQDVISVIPGGSAGSKPPSLEPKDTSLWLPLFGGIPEDNRARRLCYWLVEGVLWQELVRASIVFHWLVVALGDEENQIVEGFYVLFTAVFVFDIAFKIIARGLMAPREAVLRDPISAIDVILTLINCLDSVPMLHSKILRAVPCLRLLRVYLPMHVRSSRPKLGWQGCGGPGAGRVWGGGWKGLYEATFGNSLWMIAAIAFAAMLAVVMALVGMEVFGGRLGRCSCGSWSMECLGIGFGGQKATEVVFGGQFLSPCARWSAGWWEGGGKMDSFGEALLTVLEIATFKWGLALRPDPSPYTASEGAETVPGGWRELYIGWVVITSSVLVESLFAALLVQRVMGHGKGKVSEREERLRVYERLLTIHRPQRPTEWPMRKANIRCRDILRHPRYRAAVAISLVLNLVLLCSLDHDPSLAMNILFQVQDYSLFAVIVCEVSIGMVGFGWKNYFVIPLHWLDLAAIIASIASYAGSGGANSLAMYIRMLRVVRLLPLLLRRSPAFALLAEGLDEAKTQVLSCLVAVGCCLAGFAPVMTASFQDTRDGKKLGSSGNLTTVGWSFVTLGQVVIGGDWQILSRDLSVSGQHCSSEATGNDCGSRWAPVLLLSLKAVVEGVVLNLLLGSLVEGLRFSSKRRLGLGPYLAREVKIEKQIKMFAEHWESVDPGGAGRIKIGLVGLLMWMLPKPLGFGKKSKLQSLSEAQKVRLVAITTELQIVAGLSDKIHVKSSTQELWERCKRHVQNWRRIFVSAVCCLTTQSVDRPRGRRSSAASTTGVALQRTESEKQLLGDRFWLENAGKLAPTYHPRGKVDSVWLNVPLGDTVTFEQVGAALMAWMVPDALSPERMLAREELTRLVNAAMSAARIRTFLHRCLNAEQAREARAERRQKAWRHVTLALAAVKLGTVSSITAMGFGTWEPQARQRVVVHEKMEADLEKEEVERLLQSCREELAAPTPRTDVVGLRITMQSLQSRQEQVQARLDEQRRAKEAREAEEEAMRLAMMARVSEICSKGHEEISKSQELLEACERTGPLKSDHEIDKCLKLVAVTNEKLEAAHALFQKAERAGEYYGIKDGVDQGISRVEELRDQLEAEEARMLEEDRQFRAPLSLMAAFTRLENAEAFANMNTHSKQRGMTKYFAVVVLQAYARRKQARIQYALLCRRRNMVGGRFIPLGSTHVNGISVSPERMHNTSIDSVGSALVEPQAGRTRLKLLKASQIRSLHGTPRRGALSYGRE